MAKLKQSIINLGVALNGEKPSGHYVTEILKSVLSDYTNEDIEGKSLSDILSNAAQVIFDGKLVVEPEAGTTNVLGKLTSALQSDVAINNGVITGTLAYVTGYTGFSGKVAEQSGNYLVLKANSVEGAVITAELIGGDLKHPVTLDEDKNIVFRIKNNNQKIEFKTTKDGVTSVKQFTLNLTLNAE
ncbi:MAG: hypothetical protein IJJ10_06685 [Bacillus sp. (in: Bacteria)]|nr:hypothetical protein [Bacillus sp. (in: firmicutes)]